MLIMGAGLDRLAYRNSRTGQSLAACPARQNEGMEQWHNTRNKRPYAVRIFETPISGLSVFYELEPLFLPGVDSSEHTNVFNLLTIQKLVNASFTNELPGLICYLM